MPHPVSGLYSPELVLLWRQVPQGLLTLEQFVHLWVQQHPVTATSVYRPFPVVFHTLPGQRRARSIMINPNLKCGFSRMLWDIRCAIGSAWNNAVNRVRLLVGGTPVTERNYVRLLRASPQYSLHVEQQLDGAESSGFELPSKDPAEQELAMHRADAERHAAANRAGRTTTPASNPEVLRVLDAVTDNFAQRMTDATLKANAGQNQANVRVLSNKPLAYAHAVQALRDPKIYAELGYSGAEDFFTRGLSAQSPTAAINSLGHDLAAAMRKTPATLRSADTDTLKRLYTTKAIEAPLMSQWRNTIQSWLGQQHNQPTTAEFSVASDFGLVAQNSKINKHLSAKRSHEKRGAYVITPSHQARVKKGESPFDSYQFANREEKTQSRLDRWKREHKLLQSPRTNVTAQVEDVPDADYSSLVGSSLQSSMPAAIPIESSMPAAIPIESSMPAAVPIESSMPAAIPIESSMPAAVPISCGVCHSGPKKEETEEEEKEEDEEEEEQEKEEDEEGAKEEAPKQAPTELPIFASMHQVRQHPIRSIASDPLAAELAREVLNSGQYAGLIVPDESVISGSERANMAKYLRTLSADERHRAVSPYQLPRNIGSSVLNSLLAGQAEPATNLMAGNSRLWTMHTRDDGSIHLRDHSKPGTTHVPASVYRIQERPEAALIYAPITKSGQM